MILSKRLTLARPYLLIISETLPQRAKGSQLYPSMTHYQHHLFYQ